MNEFLTNGTAFANACILLIGLGIGLLFAMAWIRNLLNDWHTRIVKVHELQVNEREVELSIVREQHKKPSQPAASPKWDNTHLKDQVEYETSYQEQTH